MKDCPGRWRSHPAGAGVFHHALRRCTGCRRTGCVVPRCHRHLFDPAARGVDWMTTKADGRARSLWRCTSCAAADSEFA